MEDKTENQKESQNKRGCDPKGRRNDAHKSAAPAVRSLQLDVGK